MRIRSTLFAKQLAVLASAVVIAFGVAAAAFYFLIAGLFSADKESELEYLADNLDYFVRVYIASGESRFALSPMLAAIQMSSERSGAIVMLVDESGRLIRLAAPDGLRAEQDALLSETEDEGGWGYSLKDARQYSRVFAAREGETIKDVSDFYGLFKNTGYPWLNIQKRYEITRSGEPPFIYAISLHAPMLLAERARLDMLWVLLRAAALSLPLCIVVGFIFTRRLTRPIREISAASRKIANGDFSERIRIASRDEIGQLAVTFNHMAVELGNIEAARRAFIANVSHELRTPMTSIKGFVDGILDGTVPLESQGRYLQIVRDETERLNRLVNNLLDLARFESGERKLAIARFDVAEVMRRCVVRFAQLLEEKSLDVETRFERDAVFVEADEDSIEQVVYNLLHNAIKFSNEGGRIQLAVKEERDCARVSVSDDGVGIAEDELTSIWERFYKSDKSRAMDKTGAGLGLAIIRNIIHEHRQTVNVYSKLGEGTTFEFTLKLAQ